VDPSKFRYTTIQAMFGMGFGGIATYVCGGAWWIYLLAIPAAGAIANLASRRRLRSYNLKPAATYDDYMDGVKRRRAFLKLPD
jgi:hypothetical protein